MSDTFRKESRKDWVSSTDIATTNDIKLGCLQRIADATELMAKRHSELVEQRDRYQRWYETEIANRKLLERQLAASKGQITKLKRAALAARTTEAA